MGLNGGPDGAAGPSNTAGGCDIDAVFAKAEYGCTTANCHGTQFQGALDLASPNLAQRLVGVPSTTVACGGQLLIDPKAPDESMLLRSIDAARFAASPERCGVLMPLGSTEGMAASDINCVENWVRSVASTTTLEPEVPLLPFEPLGPESYMSKVKTLLTGGAVTAAELEQVRAEPAAFDAVVAGWLTQPGFQQKLKDFLAVALQQRLIGSLDFQLDTLQGQFRNQLRANAEESFVRTAWDLVERHRPYTEVLTTKRFAVTTGLLVALAYTDNTDAALRAESHMIYRDPPAGAPAAPWSLAYSLSNKRWIFPALPAGCDALTTNGVNVFDALSGFVRCPQPLGNTSLTMDTPLTAADFADWRFVEIAPASVASPAVKFYDLAALRSGTTVRLKQPRVGFFTTPAFLGNWDTNDGNQFRVTTSQTLLAALGEAFSPVDGTKPVRLDGLDAEHSPGNSTCYGCHQFLDPMRGYFSRAFSIDYQAPVKPTTTIPSFSFQGVTHDDGDLDDLALTLAEHPLFASAWTQKLCYWANSQGCDPTDPEFQRLAKVFADSGFDLIRLVQELVTSPLVTGAEASATYRKQDYLISITRRGHLCQMIDARLGTVDTCKNVGAVVGLIPQDEFSRGTPVPVQPALSSLFHFAATESLCAGVSRKLVGTGLRFEASKSAQAIEELTGQLMGLSPAHPRAADTHARLTKFYDAARTAGASTTIALRDTVTLACLSPDVMALGL